MHPLCKILNTSVMSICLVKQNDGTWVEKHQRFLFNVYKRILFLSRFLRFLTFFYFFSGTFFYIYDIHCMLAILTTRSNNQVHIDEINESVFEKYQKSFMFIVFCLFIIKQVWIFSRIKMKPAVVQNTASTGSLLMLQVYWATVRSAAARRLTVHCQNWRISQSCSLSLPWQCQLRCPVLRCHLLQPSLAVKNTAAKPNILFKRL